MGPLKGLCWIVAVLALLAARSTCLPRPDSAGIVEMPPGLAYGGIPYGSVTGMVADYYTRGQRAPVFQSQGQPARPVYYT